MCARAARIALALAGLLAIFGCAGRSFVAEVTRFHAFAADAPAEQRVTITPAREALRQGDFGRYARRLGERLGELGFRPAGEGPADIVARLDYAVTPLGREGTGEGPARYARRIELVLTEASGGRHLWEGRAESVGPVGDLDFVFPRLVRALLDRFPGPPGESETVSIPLTGSEEDGNEDDEGGGAEEG